MDYRPAPPPPRRSRASWLVPVVIVLAAVLVLAFVVLRLPPAPPPVTPTVAPLTQSPTAGVSPTLAPTPTQPATPPPTALPPSPTPSTASTPSPTVPPTPTLAPPPTGAPTPTPAPTPVFTEFSDGTWEIGVDLEPGTYRTVDYTDGCYWARLSGFSGELSDIIANEIGSGYQVATIKPSDVAFESNNCGDWTSDLSQVTETDTSFEEGTYIVGTDMRPGTYRSSQGDGCYWARLRGFDGTLGEIIANDIVSGSQAIVTIKASDKGFTSSGCGTWTLH